MGSAARDAWEVLGGDLHHLGVLEEGAGLGWLACEEGATQAASKLLDALAQRRDDVLKVAAELGLSEPSVASEPERLRLLRFLAVEVQLERYQHARKVLETEQQQLLNADIAAIAGVCDVAPEDRVDLRRALSASIGKVRAKAAPWHCDMLLSEADRARVQDPGTISDLAGDLEAQHRHRSEMLLQRFDVTFDAFLASDRAKRERANLAALVRDLRTSLPSVRPVSTYELVASTRDSLHVGAHRLSVHADQVRSFRMPPVPTRGGELIPPAGPPTPKPS